MLSHPGSRHRASLFRCWRTDPAIFPVLILLTLVLVAYLVIQNLDQRSTSQSSVQAVRSSHPSYKVLNSLLSGDVGGGGDAAKMRGHSNNMHSRDDPLIPIKGGNAGKMRDSSVNVQPYHPLVRGVDVVGRDKMSGHANNVQSHNLRVISAGDDAAGGGGEHGNMKDYWRPPEKRHRFDHQADARFALGVATKPPVDEIVARYHRAWEQMDRSKTDT